MKKDSLKLLLVACGGLLFNIIFWQEKLAVNAVLFDVFVLWSVFYLYPAAYGDTLTKWLLAAHLITVAAVIIQNTFLSKLAFSATLLLAIAFAQYRHRSIWYAAGSVLMNYLLSASSVFAGIRSGKGAPVKLYGLGRALRSLVIPLLLLLAFFLLYNFANAIFQTLLNDIGTALTNFFARFFSWFSWDRGGFLLLGLFIMAGLLFKSRVDYFSATDGAKADDLSRTKHNLLKWRTTSWYELLCLLMGRFASGIMALRNEHKTAVISLLLLNLLLLSINCVDIIYVWFGFTYHNDLNLSEYVHEGTGLLIFSILLAMGLLLFFFRGNLNFYRGNRWLKMGAYAWLLQNGLLVVSVFFRDYYYIRHYGLAYKRIGVLVFLLLVLGGLVTLFFKIRARKTTYYLLRVNAWCAIVLLVVASCIHWDETIARYNLVRKETIVPDVKFLLTLSDKVLPLLEQHRDVLNDHYPHPANGEGEYLYRSQLSPLAVYEARKKDFFARQHQYSWLSWNLSDAAIKEQISERPPTAIK